MHSASIVQICLMGSLSSAILSLQMLDRAYAVSAEAQVGEVERAVSPQLAG